MNAVELIRYWYGVEVEAGAAEAMMGNVQTHKRDDKMRMCVTSNATRA